MTDQIRTLCDLPDGAMPLEVIEVCAFLDADGKRSWTYRRDGDSIPTAVGLMRMAEHTILTVADARGNT